MNSKKFILLFLIIVSINKKVQAQDEPPRNAVYIENSSLTALLFGTSTIKYDRRFSKRKSNFGFSTGLGILQWQDFTWHPRTTSLFLNIPIEFNFIWNLSKQIHYVDFALGIAPSFPLTKQAKLDNPFGKDYIPFPLPILTINYRNQVSHKVFFKTGIGIPFLLNVGIGKSF